MDAAVPTYNFDLNYSYCDDCSNLLTFATNPGNLTGDLPFIDINKENSCTKCHIDFDEDQFSVTPGQAAVFYKGDYVLGGGIISKS